MQQTNFIVELITRLKLKSPKFFRTLSTILLTAAAILEGLTWLNAIYPLPAIVLPLIGHDSAIYTAVLAFIAMLPVEDKNKLDSKLDR